MKKLYVSLLFLSSIMLAGLNAQTRYLQQVFDDSQISSKYNEVYGFNTTVLAYPTLIKQPLIMDVYQPASDTETHRPVVLYLHTGNFLPFLNPSDGTPGFNGACGGTTRDSSAVEACRRLAKMGYVALSVDYRLGWNPLAASDVDRRYGIINAAYRGIQDVRSCIRFLKQSVAIGGNPYNIDTTKIVVWGQGTGGYLSLNSVFLDNYAKVPLSTGGKFLWDHDQNTSTPPIPMIIEQVNGNINGTSVGINPLTGDTLSRINTPGYSSNFQLAVNMAGACADSAWIDPGQTPILSFHVPYDQYAPYAEGIVNVPGTNLQVVQVQGSYVIQQMMEAQGNNNVFIGKPISDLETQRLAAFANTPMVGGNNWSDPTPGLYPLVQPFISLGGNQVPATTAPWEWSAPVPSNPTCSTNKQAALLYWDTIMRFYAPRACFALGLQKCVDQVLSAKEPLAHDINVLAAPNPATDEIRFSSEKEDILAIQIYDRTGRLVGHIPEVNNTSYTLQRSGLNAGLYVVKLSFKTGFVTKLVTFE